MEIYSFGIQFWWSLISALAVSMIIYILYIPIYMTMLEQKRTMIYKDMKFYVYIMYFHVILGTFLHIVHFLSDFLRSKIIINVHVFREAIQSNDTFGGQCCFTIRHYYIFANNYLYPSIGFQSRYIPKMTSHYYHSWLIQFNSYLPFVEYFYVCLTRPIS